MNNKLITTMMVVYLSIGLGKNTSIFNEADPWNDGGSIGSTIELGYRYQFTDRITLGVRWLHISQPLVGPPLNWDNESSLDHFGVYGEIILWR